MLTRRTLFRVGGGIAVAATVVGTTGAGTAFGLGENWNELRDVLQGDLVLPADAAYGQAKQLQVGQYDALSPDAIAFCETAEDVQKTVLFAQEYDLPVRVRSGGHNLNGWSSGNQVLIVDVSRINHATVNAGGTVQVGPGTQSVDALATLKQYNKQIVTGTCPTVCAGGFISGGGVGFQTKKFGLAADRLVSAKVVLADGRIVKASATQNSDLYWALRGGGGGNFGIVVDFEVRPIDAPRLVKYETIWSWDVAATALKAWQEWTIAASRDLGSSLVVIPPYTGSPVVKIYGGYHGAQAALEQALDDLATRIGAAPLSRTVSDMGYSDAMRSLYGCGDLTDDQCDRVGRNPEAVLGRTPFQRQSYALTSRVTTTSEAAGLLSAWNTNSGSLMHRFLIVQALGGAANDVSPSATAFPHRNSQFLFGFQGGVDNEALVGDLGGWADAGRTALAPVDSGAYINFPNSTKIRSWGTANYGGNYDRLKWVKDKYDPFGFFAHPGSIPC